jgi:hypothetical protein
LLAKKDFSEWTKIYNDCKRSTKIKIINMKKCILSFVVLALGLFWSPVFSQTEDETATLGLPGDNLDLYAVLDLFQKSKTIEEFEKTLNTEKTGINNLDLNLDKKVDFIKVETKQKDKDFTFILQVDVTEKEKQDVAVILVSRDKNDKVTMQIVGDKDLYGKDYVIEPKPATPTATANPGYTGAVPIDVTAPAPTVVVVESAPIVQYVYSPVYVPYYPPPMPPPYFTAFAVVAIGVYHHNNYYYHGGYHGGYNNNTVVIHNTNNYNNYNNSRNTSNTVNRNNSSGNYNTNNNNGNKASTNQAKGASSSKSPSATPSTNQTRGSSASAKPSATPSNSQSRGSSSSAMPSASPSTNQAKGTSASPKSSSSSRSGSTGASRSGNAGRGGGGRRR